MLAKGLKLQTEKQRGSEICKNLRFNITFVVIVIRPWWPDDDNNKGEVESEIQLLVIFDVDVTVITFIKCQCLASSHLFLSSASTKSICILPAFNLLTLSRSERVDFSAPSGRPKGKQYLKEINSFKNRNNINH